MKTKIIGKRIKCMFLGIFAICLLLTGNVLHAQSKDSLSANTIPKGWDMTKYVFADTSGNTHTLKEFKGKYILVDMWASWCIPCINEFPSLDSLKQEFKGKNIAFVQISCDRQRQRWYNQLYWSKRTGIQFFINGDMKFMQDLKIATIPRYFLIDKNGKLLNGNMPKASDPETKKILLQLKGI